MTPQEFADLQYGTGMRDGRVEAIQAIRDSCKLDWKLRELRWRN